MELKGGLKSVSEILDLLQIIALGHKEGKVDFKGKEGKIVLYFKDGKIINFESPILLIGNLKNKVISGEITIFDATKAVLHFVSLWDDGEFRFREESIDVEEIGSGDTMNVIMDFTKELDEMPPKLRDILKMNTKFTVSESLEREEVFFKKEEWKIFIEAIKGKRAKEIVFLNFPLKNSVNCLVKFLKEGVLVPSNNNDERESVAFSSTITKRYVSQEKLEKIKSILLEVMGPMGEFLIDETMEELGMTQIPENYVENFVNTLVSKIPESCLINGESCRERLKKDFIQILSF